jgi:hypothetical protein
MLWRNRDGTGRSQAAFWPGVGTASELVLTRYPVSGDRQDELADHRPVFRVVPVGEVPVGVVEISRNREVEITRVDA